MSTGLRDAPKGGIAASTRALVTGENSGTESPTSFRQSAMTMPAPPEVVRIAERPPLIRFSAPSTWPIPMMSSMSSIGMTPYCEKTADQTRSSPVRAAVWLLAASRAEGDRPAFRTATATSRSRAFLTRRRNASPSSSPSR